VVPLVAVQARLKLRPAGRAPPIATTRTGLHKRKGGASEAAGAGARLGVRGLVGVQGSSPAVLL